jgi:hypothetical protein
VRALSRLPAAIVCSYMPRRASNPLPVAEAAMSSPGGHVRILNAAEQPSTGRQIPAMQNQLSPALVKCHLSFGERLPVNSRVDAPRPERAGNRETCTCGSGAVVGMTSSVNPTFASAAIEQLTFLPSFSR